MQSKKGSALEVRGFVSSKKRAEAEAKRNKVGGDKNLCPVGKVNENINTTYKRRMNCYETGISKEERDERLNTACGCEQQRSKEQKKFRREIVSQLDGIIYEYTDLFTYNYGEDIEDFRYNINILRNDDDTIHEQAIDNIFYIIKRNSFDKEYRRLEFFIDKMDIGKLNSLMAEIINHDDNTQPMSDVLKDPRYQWMNDVFSQLFKRFEFLRSFRRISPTYNHYSFFTRRLQLWLKTKDKVKEWEIPIKVKDHVLANMQMRDKIELHEEFIKDELKNLISKKKLLDFSSLQKYKNHLYPLHKAREYCIGCREHKERELKRELERELERDRQRGITTIKAPRVSRVPTLPPGWQSSQNHTALQSSGWRRR